MALLQELDSENRRWLCSYNQDAILPPTCARHRDCNNLKINRLEDLGACQTLWIHVNSRVAPVDIAFFRALRQYAGSRDLALLGTPPYRKPRARVQDASDG